MELGEQSLEGQQQQHAHWNPGISSVSQQQQSDVVWSPIQAAECLMSNNGSTVVTNDHVSSMFGGYPLILSSSEFSRHHRFPIQSTHTHPSSSMHFSNISSSPSLVVGVGHSHHNNNHDGLTLNNMPSTLVNDSDNQQQQQQDVGHGLVVDECSEECSDDDDDEEEDEDDEDSDDEDEMGYVHHNNQSIHTNLNVVDSQENNSLLPSCQQQHTRQLRVDDVNMMGNNMDDPSCHQKNSLMSHVHDIEEDIPTINQGHPLNSNPISAIPMITTGMMMPDQDQLVVNNGSQQSVDPLSSLTNNMGINNGDPSNCNSNGHSVHGKMYVEERVVFHLKQWTDSFNFNSCREQDQHQQKNQYRCAVCHIRSPHNNISQKGDDTHRHLVRGILFQYDDCIVLELYPEYTDGQETRSDQALSMDPKQSIHMESTKNDDDNDSVPLSYFNSSSATIPNIVLTTTAHQHPLEKPHDHHNHNQQQQHEWWDYDRDAHVGPSESCAINLTAQQFHDAHAAAVVTSEETDMDEEINDVQQQLEIQHNNANSSEDIHDQADYQESQSKYDSIPSSSQYYETATIPNEVDVQQSSMTEEAERLDQGKNPGLIVNDDDALHRNFTSISNNKPKSKSNKSSTKKKETKNISSNSSNNNKYPCPCCKEEISFTLKRLLKDHLQDTHRDGNELQCPSCRMQYTDAKRLEKHSCTLSVESIKHRLKIKEEKNNGIQKVMNFTLHSIQNSTNSNNTDSNTGSTDSLSSLPTITSAVDGDSEILQLVMTSKSSKIRKFSEKASRKLNKQFGEAATPTHEVNTSSQTVSQQVVTISASHEDEENATTKNNELNPHSNRSSKFSSTTSPTIKVNQDQNLYLEPLMSTRKSQFRCEVENCGKLFSQYRRLVKHASCHKSEQKPQCHICRKIFQRRDKLLRHMFVHSEKKQFFCNICDPIKRFSRPDKLSDHLKSHQTEEIHNCNLCQRQFLRPDILKQHVRMHEMEDKHQCSVCLRFVSGRSRYNQHMKRHEEAKGQTLLCPLCTKYFIQTQSLKAHIRKFHREELDQLNLHQINNNIGSSSSDEKEFVQNRTTSPSGSNSDSSTNVTETRSLITNSQEIVLKKSSKTKTPVCQVLENVMSSNSKSKPKFNSNKVVMSSIKPSSTTDNNEIKSYSCAQCPKSFTRNQTLKHHELHKHSDKHKNKSSKKSNTSSSVDKSQKGVVVGQNVTKKKAKLDFKIAESDLDLVKKNNSSAKKEKISKNSKLQKKKTATESSSPSNLQIIQQRLTLPSCATLTHDLGFNNNELNTNSNPLTFQPSSQQSHLTTSAAAYSHHHQLALSMIPRVGMQQQQNNISSPHQLQNPCNLSLDSVLMGVAGHQNIQHQHLSSFGGGIAQSSLICPQTSSSFIINYPTFQPDP